MLAQSFQVWVTLMLRDIRTRRGHSRLNFLLTMLEPVGQIALVYLVFAALGRKPDFGNNLLLFLMSGVLPYFLFTHVVSRVMGAIRTANPMRALRLVNTVDVAIAYFLLESLNVVVVGSVMFLLCWFAGIPGAQPYDFAQVILAVGFMCLLGFGVGLFNGCMLTLFTAYRLVWSLTARSLIFFSDVFFVVEVLRPEFREVLWWNPVLHGVIWFRTGVFAFYPNATLSRPYMIACILAFTLLGLALERFLRREA